VEDVVRASIRASTRLLRSIVRSRSQSFESFDGTNISYEVWGPADGNGPVILNHGFAVDTRVNWFLTGIVDRLVKEQFTVIGIDARGQGRSQKLYDTVSYGEDIMAKDVGALLDVLQLTEVDVVGYSMGAVVSVVLATSDERVRRLIVGGVGKAVVELGGLDTGEVSNFDIADALESEDPEVFNRDDVSGFRMLADFVRADRKALAAVARAARHGALPLDRIAARTLIIAGSDDPLATSPDLLAEAIPGAHLTLVPGDHLGAVASSEFVDAVVNFLNKPIG
jgi:pimeloyl-ACP methyl ester carboxylesterase